MGLDGVKFRRQQTIGAYIVDFVSFGERLVVEVDGGQHNTPEALSTDCRRTAWLQTQGFRVLRFWNNEVLSNLDGALWRIREACQASSPSPQSSPIKGEEDSSQRQLRL